MSGIVHQPTTTVSMTSDAAVEKFRFLKPGSADNAVRKATAGSQIIGSSGEYDYTSGASIDVVLDGLPWVTCGDTVSRLNMLASDANGKAVVATVGQYVGGYALADGVVGDYIPYLPARFINNNYTSTLSGSKTFDPASLLTMTQEITTVTVTGAALGDKAEASFSLDLAGVNLFAYVSATDTVSCVFDNGTAGTVNLGSGTLSVKVKKG